mmetsp:Transcript_27078/g.36877  ORF Transcript_27078/g.36877 Transcript_27078/m.36877 type:complete len:80 (-) Transcript_27078:904-1143(-)
MISTPILGAVMDLCGRKIPSIGGYLICGLTLILMPYFHKVYPELLLFRILLSTGMLPAISSPLVVDYVQKQSLGRAVAY